MNVPVISVSENNTPEGRHAGYVTNVNSVMSTSAISNTSSVSSNVAPCDRLAIVSIVRSRAGAVKLSGVEKHPA